MSEFMKQLDEKVPDVSTSIPLSAPITEEQEDNYLTTFKNIKSVLFDEVEKSNVMPITVLIKNTC